MDNINKDDLGICPECNSKNISEEWNPPSYILTCKKCKWSVGTTKFPPIFEDETIYGVYLIPESNDNYKSISIIKSYRNVNTIKAKILLTKNKILLFKGKAVDVFKKINDLKSKKINISIVPDFQYMEKDLMGINIL